MSIMMASKNTDLALDNLNDNAKFKYLNMPLAMADHGVNLRIKKINGNEQVRHHLGNLGFVSGAEVSVVTDISGNVIVSIKDSRIAISKSMAAKIIV